jgi:hypothetical protein
MSEEPVNLRQLLEAPGTDFPTRPNLPEKKTFYGNILSVEGSVSKNKQTPSLKFHIKITGAGKDVPKSWLDDLALKGFNLGDYDITHDMWLTPGAMPMNWETLESMGFSKSGGFLQTLDLDKETFLPTRKTQEKIRGIAVMFQTDEAYEGRVMPRAAIMTGVKK